MTMSPRKVPGNETAAEIAGDLWFHRQVEHLHRLGPRVLGELLTEIGEHSLSARWYCSRAFSVLLSRPTSLGAMASRNEGRSPGASSASL